MAAAGTRQSIRYFSFEPGGKSLFDFPCFSGTYQRILIR